MIGILGTDWSGKQNLNGSMGVRVFLCLKLIPTESILRHQVNEMTCLVASASTKILWKERSCWQ